MAIGKLIVLTAPLTEIIDHAGYFIQMGMASMPIWMEFVFNEEISELERAEVFRRRLSAFCSSRSADSREGNDKGIRHRECSSLLSR